MCSAKGEVQREVWIANLPGGPQIGEWYRVKIDVVGNSISYYVDGKLLHQAKDNLHSSGGVNLYAYNASMEFDNIVITGDEIPDAGPGGYAVQPIAKSATTWGRIKR